MPRKNDRSREIDLKLIGAVVGGDPPTASIVPTVGPPIPTQPAPTGLAIASNTILFSAVTPMALVGLTWNAPPGTPPAYYVVEYATNSTFTTNLQRVNAYQASAQIDLPANTLYYFRVQGVTNFVSSAFSATVSVTTATDTTAAGQPTSIASDWSGADLVLTWVNPTNANLRDIEVRIWNSSGKTVLYHTGYSATGRYTWTLPQQRIDTSGALDPSVFFELRSRTWANTLGTAPAGSTITNSVPTPPIAVSFIQSPGSITITITAPPPADFAAYRYRIIQTLPSAADVTFDSPSALAAYSLYAQATYQVGVKVLDVFGQLSTETLSSATIVDTLTIGALRADIIYSDNDGNSDATLHVPLSNAVLTSGGITYATSSSWNKWIRGERPLLERYRTMTLSMTPASGTSSWYVRLSSDASTWTYYAGPVTSSRILTLVASAAAAQAAAVSAATLGGQTTSRVELPSTVEARFIEVWFRNAGPANTRIDEFYPRRLVEADDIKVENLSGISADLGTITAGTITGATIQTATSGARVRLDSTGLTTYDSANVVQVTATTATNGVLTAGAGAVQIDKNGTRIESSSTGSLLAPTAKNALQFMVSSAIDAYLSDSYSIAFAPWPQQDLGLVATGNYVKTISTSARNLLTLMALSVNGSNQASIQLRGGSAAESAKVEISADILELNGDLIGDTFTPTYYGSTTAGATTYTTQYGEYRRIGDVYHIWLRVAWTAATGTGSIVIGGLPAAIGASSQAVFTVFSENVGYTNAGLRAYTAGGFAYLLIYDQVVGGFTSAAIDAAGTLVISGSYKI